MRTTIEALLAAISVIGMTAFSGGAFAEAEDHPAPEPAS